MAYIKKFTVTIRKRGAAYTLYYPYIDSEGERRQKTETCYSEEEALKRKAELEYQFTQKKFVTPNDITFDTLFETWLELYASNNLKANTFNTYKRLIENHVLPVFGKKAVQDIDPIDVERLLNNLRHKPRYAEGITPEKGRKADGKKLSTSTIAFIYSGMNSIFEKAVQWKYIGSSPVQCGRPKVVNKKVDIISPEEMFPALNAMRLDGLDMLELAVHISVVGSARKGEVGGLTWDNFDEGIGEIHFEKQLQRLYKSALDKIADEKKPLLVFPSDESSKSVLALTSLKTEGSDRYICLTTPLIESLRKRKAEYERLKAFYSETGEFHDYNLIISHPNGMPVDTRRLNHWLEKFLHNHPEYPNVCFHSIRHTSTTLLMHLSGNDAKTVADNTGHKNVKQVLDRYGNHSVSEWRKQLTNKLETFFYKDSTSCNALNQTAIMSFVEKLMNNPELLDQFLKLNGTPDIQFDQT